MCIRLHMLIKLDLSSLRNQMAEARSIADALGFTAKDLNNKELEKIGQSYDRQFIQATTNREIKDIYSRHQAEAILGAMIAKDQMSAEIDGEQPGAGKIGGPLVIRAQWLGIGDDWNDGLTAITTGAPQNWIHSGTTLMAGSAGNAVKIGKNQVTVVFGIGEKHPSPKLESVQFTIDQKVKPTTILDIINRPSGGNSLQIKEFDSVNIWKKDTTVLAKIMAGTTYGATIAVIPYPIGVSYIKEDVLRLQDGATLPGTTYDAILTT